MPSRRDERRAAAELRNRKAAQRRPLAEQLAQVERELASIESRTAEIDATLADPQRWRDGTVAAELGRERGGLQKARDAAEERWLDLSSALESLDADAGG